jgi:hypothetical protein
LTFYINHTDGTSLVSVQDGTIDNTSTSITLVGKNFPTYGQYINQNLVSLLENSANTSSPLAPLKGQLWYNSSDKTLNYYREGSTTNTWKKLATTIESSTQPTDTRLGDLWWDTVNVQLKIYDGISWKVVGPSTTSSGQLNIASNNDFQVYIGGNKYLNIDNIGGATLPYNPCVFGYDSYPAGTTNLTSGGVGSFLPWKPIVTVDRGSNFTQSTGVFSVKTSGVYQVYSHVTAITGTTAGTVLLKWQKNSADINIAAKRNSYSATLAGQSNQLVCSGMISALAGDTIKLMYATETDATCAISYTNSSYSIQLVG